MATTAAAAVRKVGVSTWTVLEDRTDRVRAIVSSDGADFTVRNDSGTVLGRFGTVHEALAALPGLCD